MDIKFLTQENEIQKLYSKFGLVVPVGDLSNTKAPAVSVNNITILDEPFYYPEDTEPVSQRTAEFDLNVLTGAQEYNIVMCAYPKSVIDNCSEFQDGVVPTDFDLDDAINNPDSQSCLHTATNAIFATPSQRGYSKYKAPFYDGSDYGEYVLIVSSYNYAEPYPYYTTTYAFNYEAPVNWATADEVLEGNKFIGEDGQEAVGTYVPESGPGTGGATVQSCTMDYVSDPGMGEYHRYSIVLDTMPAYIDPVNHRYYAGVFALCYNADPFSDYDFDHLSLVSGQSRAEFDLENNTIYDYFGSTPNNQYWQQMSSTSGCVVLYDGSIANPIYKWPCTITIQNNSQQ